MVLNMELDPQKLEDDFDVCGNLDVTDLIIRDTTSHQILTRKQEKLLGVFLLDKQQWAMDIMLRANMRLVVSIAKKYIYFCGNFEITDLIQEGYFGLVKAVAGFDHRKNIKFSTYATWWIKQSITRAIKNLASTIRNPIHVTEKLHKLSDAKQAFALEHQREPTLEELSKELGIPRAGILNALGASRFEKSLSDNMSDYEAHCLDIDRHSHMKDIYLNDPDIKLSAKIEVEDMCNNIASVIACLKNRRNIEIISYRCGLDADFEIMSLEDVGSKFDLTRERVRQIMLRFYKLVKARDRLGNNSFKQDKSLENAVVRLVLLAELAGFDYDDLRSKIFRA